MPVAHPSNPAGLCTRGLAVDRRKIRLIGRDIATNRRKQGIDKGWRKPVDDDDDARAMIVIGPVIEPYRRMQQDAARHGRRAVARDRRPERRDPSAAAVLAHVHDVADRGKSASADGSVMGSPRARAHASGSSRCGDCDHARARDAHGEDANANDCEDLAFHPLGSDAAVTLAFAAEQHADRRFSLCALE